MKYIILIAIISSILAQQQDLFPEFQALDKTEFGRTLIDTLQIHLSSNEPLSSFIDIMRNMELQVEDEQRADDDRQRAFSSNCDKDINEYSTQINLLSRRMVDTQSSLEQLQTDSTMLLTSLNVKQQWNDELNKRIESLEMERKTQKDLHEQATRENEYVMYAIGTVKALFQDSRSFLQVSESPIFQQMQKALDETAKFSENKSYQYIFQVLSQVAQSSEGQDRLFEICQDLLNNVDDNQSLLRRTEDKRVSIYLKKKDLLTKDGQKSNEAIADLGAQNSNLQDKIQVAKNDLDDATQRQQSIKNQVKDRQDECKLDAYTYEQSRKDSDNKRNLISQVIGLFSANQREFKEYINNRKV